MNELLAEMAVLSPKKRKLLLALMAQQGLAPFQLPILPQDRGAGLFPLSLAQRRMWLLHQSQDPSLYNTSWNLLLGGPLDRGALARSLTLIVRRHETLRTHFPLLAGAPRQCVAPAREIDPPLLDLSGLPDEERAAQLRRLVLWEGRRPLNLEHGPILRTTLLRLSSREHALLVTTHHIVSDGWSTGIFDCELRAAYEALSEGRSPDLPELSVQYVDYACWQQQWQSGALLEAQAAYWQHQLDGLPLLVTLPADRPRRAGSTPRGKTLQRSFETLPDERLRELGRPAGASLFMTLAAAFAVLLSRYTGSLDIPIGSPISNRNRRELEPLIGCFVNTLVLRVDLAGNPTFRQLLERVRDMILAAHAHQDLPFDQLVDGLRIRRQAGVNPLFQVAFMLQVPEAGAGRAAGLEIRRLMLDDETARVDLEVQMWESGKGPESFWAYDLDLFDGTTIARAAAHFQTLLRHSIAEPDRPVAELPVLDEAERHCVLEEWNDTRAEHPCQPLHRRFEEWAEHSPHALAVVLGEQRWTYQELNRGANRLARRLVGQGVGPDVLVGIGTARSPELVLAVLAVLKAGGAFLPLAPEYPAERLSYMIRDAAVEHLITLRGALSHLERIERLPQHVIDLDGDRYAGPDAAAENLGLPVLPAQLAYVIYTSGSTGRPKGVLLGHGGLSNLAQTQQELFQTRPGSRILQFASASFDAFVWEVAMALSAGATLCLADADDLRPGPSLQHLLATQRLTHATLPPTALNLLAPQGLPDLRHVISAGEACSQETTAAWASGRRFFNAYGPTEVTVCATVKPCQPGEQATIGRPLSNLQAYVLDPWLQPVPTGVTGELVVGGQGLARGYHRRPALTASRFLPSPFAQVPGQRLYRTGDLARFLPGGEIEFMGRVDRQVKIHGLRIELGEIEATLLHHPAVREAAVLVRKDPESQRLAAYLVVNGPGDPGGSLIEELKAWTRSRVPAHQIPALWFVLEEMPVTANGKIDHQALAAMALERPELRHELTPPRTPLEERIAKVWTEVLQLSRVGVHDDFFDLGGDSILSIRMTTELRKAGIEVVSQQILQHPTIAGLAESSEAGVRVQAEQGAVTGAVTPTPIQAWFLEGHLSHPHHFNQAVLLEIPAAWTAARLRAALSRIVDQHDALRLRWRRGPGIGSLEQGVPEKIDVLSVHDLSSLASEVRAQALEKIGAELQASLDLTRGPVLRLALFHMGPEQPERLLWIVHHLVVDAMSWPVLIDDLITLCDQLQHDKPLQLPPKTTSFKEWADQLAAHADSPILAAELAVWTSARRLPARGLPADHPGGTGTAAGATIPLSLDARDTRFLVQELARVTGRQISEVLLTAIATAFAQWTGERAVVVDLEGHGREALFRNTDLSRTVGWFTSLYPVVLEVLTSRPPAESLDAIAAQLRAVPNHGIGYGILRYLSPDEGVRRSLAGLPAAQISFNYQGRIDRNLSATAVQLAAGAVGPLRAPGEPASHGFEINAMILDGQLLIEWTYDAALYREDTVRGLVETFRQALQALIGHARGVARQTRKAAPEGAEAVAAQRAVEPALVPMRATGSKAPFFCFPGSGGNPLYLHPLVRHLDAQQPFFALQARGLDGRRSPHRSIAEVAADSLHAIRRVQPYGPYLLGGHSFGGWVAFHTAWLLRQQAEAVAGLVIFDTPAPLPENKRKRAGHDELDDGRWLRGIVKLVERVTGAPLPISEDALARLSLASFLERFRDHLEAVHLLAPGSGLEHARGLLEVSKANTRALLSYDLPGRLDVPVSLLRAQSLHPDDAEVMVVTPGDPLWGWSRVTTGGVHHRIVPGDHLTMFSPAHVSVLAGQLQEILDLVHVEPATVS
jgi:amino acid adenylation domain-containing protein/non-ribosomal peptide synthase protein (TIGR01720 family)